MNTFNGVVKIFCLFLAVILFAACGSAAGTVYVGPTEGPQPEEREQPTVEPAGVVPSIVMSKDIPMDLNAQMLQNFTQAQPAVLDSLNMAAIEQDKTQGFGHGDLALNWNASQMVYKKDMNQNLLVDVIAAPIQSSNLEPEKLQVMEAAGTLPQTLTVGAVAVLSDYPDLSSGNYLLEWYPGANEMSICNPETGECKAPEFCVDSGPVLEPGLTISEGSVTICLSFDSTRCCVTFGKQ